jgi:cellulose synthase operon protein C
MRLGRLEAAREAAARVLEREEVPAEARARQRCWSARTRPSISGCMPRPRRTTGNGWQRRRMPAWQRGQGAGGGEHLSPGPGRPVEHDDHDAGVAHFLRIRDAVPDSPIAATGQHDAGALLLSTQRWEEAADIYQAFLEGWPGHALAGDARSASRRRWSSPVTPRARRRRWWMCRAWRASPRTSGALHSGRPPSCTSSRATERVPSRRCATTWAASRALRRRARGTPPARRSSRPARRCRRAAPLAGGHGGNPPAMRARPGRSAAARSPRRQGWSLRCRKWSASRCRSTRRWSAACRRRPRGCGRRWTPSARRRASALRKSRPRLRSAWPNSTAAWLSRSSSSARPAGLDEDALEQYELLLEEQAFPFEEDAIAIHEANAARARDGLYDRWVIASFEALAELVPARWNRQEAGENVVELLR